VIWRRKESAVPPGSLPVSGSPTISKTAREKAFRSYVEPEIDVLLRVAQTVTGWTASGRDRFGEGGELQMRDADWVCPCCEDPRCDGSCCGGGCR
jgi:hypothetical protein